MRFRRLAAPVLLCVCAVASTVAAQESTGGVEGVASSEDDGAPIPFALVKLLPTDPRQATTQQGITDATGRFRFQTVSPGEYRLQLLRIGYRPVLSPVLTIRPGETLSHALRGSTQAVQLAAVTVRPDATCLDSAQLGTDPRLAALWNEARKGVEIRRAFELQYRFVRTLRQDIEISWRLRRNARRVEETTTVNEPDSVLAREERNRVRNRAEGYSERGRLIVPNEKELLDDAFLHDHCLETATAEEPGAVGLRFRPVQPRRDGVDLRGTVWVDTSTYHIRRLELEHLRGGNAFARSRIDYKDIRVGASTLRLPSGGWASVRATGMNRTMVTGANAAITYTYRAFEQVRGK